jgi:hypothetical protein
MSTTRGIGTTAEVLNVKSRCCLPSLVESSMETVEPACEATSLSTQTNHSRKQDHSRAFVASCCSHAAVPRLSPGNNAHTDLSSVTHLKEGDSARNPETTPPVIAADVYIPDSGWRHSLKQVLQSFRRTIRKDQDFRNSCFSGQSSGLTVLQCFNTSTPSRSTGRAQVASSFVGISVEMRGIRGFSSLASYSEALANPNSVGGNRQASDLSRSSTSLRAQASSSPLGPGFFIHGPCKGEVYNNTMEKQYRKVDCLGAQNSASV